MEETCKCGICPVCMGEHLPPIHNGLPDDDEITFISCGYEGKDPFEAGAKWMRSLAHRKLEYWKEVALNPDCICDITTEIDKCPVHSTGPDC